MEYFDEVKLTIEK